MLEMKSWCERCHRDLPADAVDALICSFECTFCSDCASNSLAYRCPNCTGSLALRPARSAEPEAPSIRIHLYEIVVDCANPGRLAEFYGELLGVEVIERSDSWAYLVPSVRGAQAHSPGLPTRDGLRLAFQRVPEPRRGKVRLHLDFGTEDLDGMVDRALALGASQLSDRLHDDGDWIVMADPEGHEFCFVDP